MKSRKWLILLLVIIVATMSMATYTGVTTSLFIDDEQSTDDALSIRWGLIYIDDGFEGTPWDANWDENGTTTWVQDSAKPHTGTYNARISNTDTPGYLTSDDIDAAGVDKISVSFWFNVKSLEAGDCLLQLYNGSTYNTWYDLLDYPAYVNNVWCRFSELITDPQYLISGFRVRFDASALGDGTEEANIDDVYITTDSVPPAAPTGLAATLGEEQVSLDWNDNTEGDLDGYNVYRSLTSGGPYTQINGSLVATSNYTDTGLTNDITYYYVVTAVDIAANESGYSDEANATPTDLPPAAPTGLAATDGDEEVTLDWDDNTESDLAGYDVYRNQTGGEPYNKIASLVTLSEYTDTGLTNGVTYYYVVTAVDLGTNESGYSNEASATPTDVAPAAPTGLVATPGDEEVTLDWDDNTESDLAGYDVYRNQTGGEPYNKIASLVALSEYTDTGLYGGGTYYYVVKAVDLGSNESGYSNEDSAIATDVAPAAPTGLAATPGEEQVTLNWDDNTESDLAGYDVYRNQTGGEPYNKIASLVALSEYTDSGLYGGGTYYYVVKAVDGGANQSGYSNEDSAIATDVAPAAPTGLAATPGEEQVTLNWDDNTESDLAGYDVYRNQTGGEPYNKIASLVLTSDYTDTGVTELVTYYYVVKAVDLGSNESGYSNEATATPDWAPAAPASLVATDGDEEVTLDWDDNTESDLAGYDVYRNQTGGEPYNKIASLVALSEYTDSGLYGGGTYYYVVKAVDLGSNESGYSNEDSAIATDVAPAAPTGLVATPGEEQVTLNWDDNTESDLAGYDVYRNQTGGEPYNKIASLVALSEYTDTGLYGGGTYYYVVTAVDGGANQSGYSNEASATATDVAPAAPTGLVATPGDEQISLDWNDNTETDLVGYNVHRSETTGGPYTQLNGSLVATSNYTDTGVTELNTYSYVVTAVDNGANESGNSNEATTTADWAPAAPTGLVATPGDEQISLDWNDNTEGDLAGYNVHRSGTMGGPYSQINGSLVATSNYTDTGLYGGGTYYYVVTAVDNGANESGNSNEASATATDVAPAVPTGLVATPGGEQISLDWNDNTEGDLAGYNVHRSETTGGPYTQVNGSVVVTSDYTDSGLYGGGTYYYVVTAVDNEANESGNSNEASATATDVAPAAPTGLVATPSGEQVSLDWNDNTETDLAGYNVYRSWTSGGPYTQVNGSVVVTSNYTDTGVTELDTYYYVVTAVDNEANESGNSNEATATADWAPAAPTGLVATPGDKQVSLGWNDNTEGDLAGYNVYRSETTSGPYSKINGPLVATSNYTDSGLTGGVTYYYVVTAVDLGSNESDNSNEASTTPTDPPPAAPTGLVATPGVKQVSLAWNDNSEEDLAGYNVYRNQTGGEPYNKIASLVALSEYTDSGLTGGVTYYYVVTAVDLGSNESGYSNEDSATPVGLILLDDDFEFTPWDGNWDGNGTTDWQLSSSGGGYSGSYSAEHTSGGTYLTSDDLDASGAASITVSFWFKIKALSKGPLNVQIYNGTAYNTWYDLVSYAGGVKNTWLYFSETQTDSQYFKSNFRLRFDGSGLSTDGYIDDVLVQKN